MKNLLIKKVTNSNSSAYDKTHIMKKLNLHQYLKAKSVIY